jgi:hypothetical protein
MYGTYSSTTASTPQRHHDTFADVQKGHREQVRRNRGLGLAGDADGAFLVFELRQDLDQLLQEQVARGQQEVEQDPDFERDRDDGLRGAEQPFAETRPLHDDFGGLRGRRRLGRLLDLLRRSADLFHRTPELAQLVPRLRQGGWGLLQPGPNRVGQ